MSENTLIPNTYQKPNAYSDIYDYYLTPAESKVLDFFVRRILGYEEHRQTLRDRISLSQICDGIKNKDGKWVTLGTGMSRPEVVETIKTLMKFGFIVPVGEATRSGQEYRLVLDDKAIDLDGLKTRKEAAREAGRKRTSKARSVLHTNGASVSQTNHRSAGLTGSGQSGLPPVVSQTDTQNPVQNPVQNPGSRVSDETRPSPPSASKNKTPAVAKDTPEPSEPIAPPAPPTTWDDVEAAPAEARRAGRKWTDEHLDWYEALVRVTTGWTRVEFEQRKSERIQKRYHAAAKRLREAGYHTTDLISHYERGGWWWTDHWLGKERGEWPTVETIEDTWGDWLKSPVAVEAPAPKYPAYNPMPEDQRIPIPQTKPFWFLPGEIRA